MYITENILLSCCSSLFILLLISLFQTSHATNSHTCSPSSCGDIRNISFPFRLKPHPKHCGNPDYELACENNVLFINLNSQKYKVKAINYHNFTITLVDVSINSNICSFPNHSLYQNFRHGYPYSTGTGNYRGYFYTEEEDFPKVYWPINFMSCPYPLKNSSLFTETIDCASRGHVFDDGSMAFTFTYIKVGHMNASEVGDMCRIDVIAMTSWKFEDLKKNVSLSEIHDSLLYGFELSWLRYPCTKCKQISDCYLEEDHKVTCYPSYSTVTPIVTLIVVIIVYVQLCY